MRNVSNNGLYFGVLMALIFLVLIALGEGFWGSDGNLRHWTTKLFYGICHQLPDRTYSFNNELMAVNTRCFGIFTGLFAGWLLIPLFKSKQNIIGWMPRIFLVAVLVQIIDYSGNLLSMWENTNHSRAFLGGFLGISASLLLTNFFKPLNKYRTHGKS